MPEQQKDSRTYFIHGKIDLPYKFAAGRPGSKFLIALRDQKKFMGLKCPACNRVYVPPRSTCMACFGQIDEWVDVSDQGSLLAYTVINEPNSIQLKEPPYAYGIIQLDGADTGLVHLLDDVDLEQLKIGMRFQAVFKEERVGSILDIECFKPVA